MRLNQAVAQTGLCSRRKADELIAAGRVAINGQICTDFSYAVNAENDSISIDGRTLRLREFVYILLNKPPGIITTTADERARKTVIDLLPEKLRHLKPIGRLDMYSEGLLLLTNDGALAQRLTHPSEHLPKLYNVTVRGQLSEKDLKLLAQGVPLEDGITLPAEVRIVEQNKTYCQIEIALIQGRNRQIRRMFAYLGYPVVRLVRVAIGGLQLGQMALGTWRYLSSQEVSQLENYAE